jgi:hypothetical protein
MKYVINQPIQIMLFSGGLKNTLKKIDLIFIFVKSGSDPSSKNVKIKKNQNYSHANKNKQSEGLLQAKSVVYLGSEKKESTTTSGS